MMVVQKTSALLIFIIGLHICKGQNGLDDLGDYISNSVQRSLSSLGNLGPKLEQRLAPLNNLGDSISRQVYEGLKPVHILQSIVKVTQGTDGTTIATFSPNNKKFIIREGVFYECDGGSISYETGSCSGTLKGYSFDKREDFCYSSSKTLINNKWYCLSVGFGGVSTSIINGQIYCNSRNNPALLITVDEYKTLCENVARSVRYKYFTNNKIQEFGNGLRCTGGKPQICTFSRTINNNDNVSIINSS